MGSNTSVLHSLTVVPVLEFRPVSSVRSDAGTDTELNRFRVRGC